MADMADTVGTVVEVEIVTVAATYIAPEMPVRVSQFK
jgi:hypothetical protein